MKTYVATGEVTTLEHEVGDHTVKLWALISKAFLAGAKGPEVLGGFGNDLIVEIEVDSTLLL